MTNQTLITRKELSLISGLTVRVIGAHEERFGLIPCKVQWGTKRISYNKTKAIKALITAGIIKV